MCFYINFVRTQDSSSLTRPTILGLQFTYIVGIGFPTLGSSQASFKKELPSHRDAFHSLILSCQCVCSLFLSLLLPPNCLTSFSSLPFLIYSFRIVEGSSLPPEPTCVEGPKLTIFDKEYALSKMGLKPLELVLASKNCLTMWFPRAFSRYRCIAEQGMDTP